jgi:hypothetical protein
MLSIHAWHRWWAVKSLYHNQKTLSRRPDIVTEVFLGVYTVILGRI